MKKLTALLMLVCLLASCVAPAAGSLEALPGDYSLAQAKNDGCVVHEDGDVTAGKEVWDAYFVKATEAGESAAVRLGFYYTLGDPSHYDPEYYESIKADYPRFYLMDLTYDGEAYTLRWLEDGKEVIRTYRYMLRYEGEAETPYATYDSYVRYVLVNDDTVTWEDILHGLYSSQSGAYIDHYSVYTDME